MGSKIFACERNLRRKKYKNMSRFKNPATKLFTHFRTLDPLQSLVGKPSNYIFKGAATSRNIQVYSTLCTNYHLVV